MGLHIPAPVSGGLILSYKCPAACRHCIYGCSPGWSADWMTPEILNSSLDALEGKIMSNPYGPKTVGLNHGLHFTGGEPFLNFDLLLAAVEAAGRRKIPSTFVETNCFWCVDDKSTKEKLKALKKAGMRGIMISVNPFYLEHVPFERTERAVRTALDIFGGNAMVYQADYFRRFMALGIEGTLPFEEYLGLEGETGFFEAAEFFAMGRAPYALRGILSRYITPQDAEALFDVPCPTPLVRGLHNHFDNYGNYVPGFCGGISYGDVARLDELVKNGVDPEEKPVLALLMRGDLRGLYGLAQGLGYAGHGSGYLSKCHLCTDIRRHLARSGDFVELTPGEFYEHLG